jgi:hypothetical protein
VKYVEQMAEQEPHVVLIVADHPHPRCVCVDLGATMEKYAERLAPGVTLLESQEYYRVWVGVFQATGHGNE